MVFLQEMILRKMRKNYAQSAIMIKHLFLMENVIVVIVGR